MALSLLVFAPSASAQTPPPDPLSQLLPQLLAPLQPILNQLNPQAPVSAPAGQDAAAGKSASGGGGGGGGQGSQSFPVNPEYHCSGTPAPLVFSRTPPRNTQALVDAARAATGSAPLQTTLNRLAPPFPVAGLAHYRDDWGEPRTTPCPHIHQGNDIFADFGVPFVAPEAGTVARFGFEPVGGNAVYFSGDDGYGFYGAHLESIAPGLAVGQHVAAGTLLGLVGNTGDAMGGTPHLHFQIYAPGHSWGSPEDPKFWLDASLDTAIRSAGGVVPDWSLGTDPSGAPAVNPGNLVSSVLFAGGHIISQPTVPVLLFVLLLVGTLVISQTRTFKVAADVRRSRSDSSRAKITEAPLARRPGHRQRRPPPAAQALEDTRPLWAINAEAVKAAKAAEAEAAKVSAAARISSGVGEAWSKLPARLSKLSSPSQGQGPNGSHGAGGSKGSKSGSAASFSAYNASRPSTKSDQRRPGSRSGK